MQRAIVIQPNGTWSIEEYEYAHPQTVVSKYIDLFDVVRLNKYPVDIYVHDEGMWKHGTEQNYLAQFLRALDVFPLSFTPLYGPAVLMGKVDDEGWEKDIPDHFIERFGDEFAKQGLRMICPDGVTELTGQMFLGEASLPTNGDGELVVTMEIVELPVTP